MAKRVAVVTGSNKGIGLAIVRGLCKDFDGDVILTARNEGRGLAAVQTLQSEGLNPKFHQLDVTSTESITRLREFLRGTYQGLDVLVNNAGILFESPHPDPSPLAEIAAETIKVNYTSQLNVCNLLFPLLRPHARVCNVSSFGAAMSLSKCSAAIKEQFLKPGISMEELSSLMEQFVKAVEKGQTAEEGFSDHAYGMSKIGLCVMSIIQQRELDSQGAQDIVVNACSPGYVNTDMTKGLGTLTVEEGAVTPLYLCFLPPNITSPRGEMLRYKEICDWTNYTE